MRMVKMKYLKIRRILIMLIISIFLTSTALAQIEVNPSSMAVDLVGGETVTKQITVVWHGEKPVVAFIYTEIEPDGEGFEVTYSENPVVLYPDEPKTLSMNIAVDIAIKPASYTFTTVVYTSINEVVKVVYNETVVEIENTTKINELLDIIEALKEKLNQTTNQTEYLPLLNALQDSIDELSKLIREQDMEKEKIIYQYDWTPLIVFAVINVITWIIVCVYIIRLLNLLRRYKQ